MGITTHTRHNSQLLACLVLLWGSNQARESPKLWPQCHDRLPSLRCAADSRHVNAVRFGADVNRLKQRLRERWERSEPPRITYVL